MDVRELRDTLRRWQDAGLLSPESARAIEDFEAAAAPEPLEPSRRLDAGSILSYAGVLVALTGTFALYGILFPDWSGSGRIALAVFAALVALGAVTIARRMFGGWAAVDALSTSWVILTAVSVAVAFDAAGWLDRGGRGQPGYIRSLDEMRAAFLAIVTAVVMSGVVAARSFRSPLSALPAAIAAPAVPAILVWWFDQRDSDAPGLLAGETAVLAGFALALLVLRYRVRLLSAGHRFFTELGLLGTANFAAIMVCGEEGGMYEGLLLVNAIGQAFVAVSVGSRLWLTGFAVSLYAWIVFVVFRTFEAAALGVIVLIVLGLLTAVGGLWVQRGGFARLSGRLRGAIS